MSRAFNLSEALAGAACETADGRKVSKIVDMGEGLRRPLAVVVEGDDDINPYTRDGKFDESQLECMWDLRMTSTKRVVWANLANGGRWYSHSTEERARMSADDGNGYAAIAVRVEVEV